jgi:RimJ/RimL family protein N-acetyltransferase
VKVEESVLQGKHIHLEPLDQRHTSGLAAASVEDPELYQWSPVPQGEAAVIKYIETALSWKNAGTALPFAIVDANSGVVLGSTRFFDLERWAWPAGHAMHGRTTPDVGEIGYTWLRRSAIRTPVNTEAKFLMLNYGFETLNMLRVCLHTDVRNERSRAAIERIGGKFEGILRCHRMAADFIPRDSARYSILAQEWPEVKQKLLERLQR